MRARYAMAWAVFLGVVATAVGCKKSGSGFPGTWDCVSDGTANDTLIGTRHAGGEYTTTLRTVGDKIAQTSVRKPDGKSLGCVTIYTQNGNTLVADPNQTCTVKNPYGSAEVDDIATVVDSAVMTLHGDSYDETSSIHFTMHRGGVESRGTGSATVACTRVK